MLAKSGLRQMKLPDLNTVPKIADTEPKRDSLDAMTILVLQTADGVRSIGDISEVTGLEPALAQKMVLNLITKNMMHTLIEYCLIYLKIK